MKNLLTPQWHILGGGFVSSSLEKFAIKNSIPHLVLGRREINLLNPEKVREHFQSIKVPTVVLLPAAISRIRDNSQVSFQKNVEMVRNVVNSINSNIEKILFFSSIDVYGNRPNLPITENTSLLPQDYYSLSKIVGEYFTQIECEKRKVKWIILRLTGLYGINDKQLSLIGKMFRSAYRDKTVSVTGSSQTKRDYVDVEDLSRIVYELLKNNCEGIYNVASGKSYNLLHIAKKIDSLFPASSIVEQYTEETNRATELSFNINKLKKDLPQFKFNSLDNSLQKYYLKEICQYA